MILCANIFFGGHNQLACILGTCNVHSLILNGGIFFVINNGMNQMATNENPFCTAQVRNACKERKRKV